jgi:hypothetical protein
VIHYSVKDADVLVSGDSARSEELTRALHLETGSSRWVLVTVARHREWMLARFLGRRGEPVELYRQHRFNDLGEANRFVLGLRLAERLVGEPGPP